MGFSKQWCATVVVALGAVASAHAANVPVTKANGDFISGTGIPGDNFTVATGANGLSVALKARGRDTGQALSQVGSTYFVAAGASMSNPAASWWNFDFQFTPGADDTVLTSYTMTLDLDVDGSTSESYVTWSLPVTGAISWASIFSDGFFTNPGAGAWSSDDPDYVYSQSWRADFLFLAGSILGDGEYMIGLSITDALGNEVVGTDITVIVGAGAGVIVPLPTGAGMGLAGLSLLALRRRR